MMEGKKKDGDRPLTKSFVIGAIALVFLIIGYQTALFVHKAAVTAIANRRDHPDTVYIVERNFPEAGLSGPSSHAEGTPADGRTGRDTVLKRGKHSQAVESVRNAYAKRQYESFRFDPNTASIEDLQRLGFSLKQAQSIDNYRAKGGRFRRKSDFAKSYVVSDSVFQRLEPYIDIPKLDINAADSAAFETLPGIGPYFASRMVSYRRLLHGYSYPEQLMDIYHFDAEKYGKLQDLITLSQAAPYPLWTLPEDSLKRHPYIKEAARGIVLYRDHNPKSLWTVEGLQKAGVLNGEYAGKLARCRIAIP